MQHRSRDAKRRKDQRASWGQPRQPAIAVWRRCASPSAAVGLRVQSGRLSVTAESSPPGLESAHWYWISEEAKDVRSVFRSVGLLIG